MRLKHCKLLKVPQKFGGVIWIGRRNAMSRFMFGIWTISRKLDIRRLLAWLGLLFVLGTVALADE